MTQQESSAVPTEARTLAQLVRRAAAAYDDDTAIVLKGQTLPDESLSFTELERRSAAIARGLLARGIGKGARVGFIAGNGPTFATLFAAIGRIGAIAVPISTFIKSAELVRVLRQSDIGGLIVQRQLLGNDYVDRLCEALPELTTARAVDLRLPQAPYLRWIASTGPELPATIQPLERLISDGDDVSEALLAAVEAEVHPTDQLMEIYTSGAMAAPKGVKHCHGPALQRSHFLRRMRKLARQQEVSVPMPMFWVGGMMMYLLPNWEIGAVTLCGEGTSTDSRIAMGSVVARDDMYKHPPGMPIWSLGMSETLGPYSYGDELRADGYPLCAPLDHIAEGFEVRLVNDDGQPPAEGEVGELQIRGYALTPGLHKIEREEYFEPDGFYRTGDLCVREGQRLHFVGRSGDMIKTASANVSPAEVEMELQELAGIHSAYVFGVPHPERGQLVVAAVVPRDGSTLDYDVITNELRQRLSSYKVPRAYVTIAREEIPMLPSNKVARRQLEQLVAARLAEERG
jgi:acyl-CoA synthetase (AMP-forming)/AMP-acid ligase II